jgi:DNA-binding NtrC family response regulator
MHQLKWCKLHQADAYCTMRQLITWTDRVRPRHSKHAGPDDQGPVVRLLDNQPRYDQVRVLTTAASLTGARELCAKIGPHARLQLVDLTDPSDHAQLFAGLADLVADLQGQSVDVLLSAGTPQAQTLWVILVQAGLLDGRMLQVIPPMFVPVPHPEPVREVRLDIEGFPEIRSLREEVQRLRAAVVRPPEGWIGNALQPVLRTLTRLAPSRVPVWIRGETGTGKELVARALHDASDRADRAFVPVNAGAFAEGVLASELFGHEQGAFTGAHQTRRGLFEQADGGTLFLDEVGELPRTVQVNLLRVLESGSFFRRVGGETDRQVDVRIVSATHRDLRAEVEAGRFRQDLYYRLRGAELHLPPLRDRGGDLELLVHHFLTEPRHLPEATWAALRAHSWPGNVRELRAEVQRWLLLTDHTVELADLSPEIRGLSGGTPAITTGIRPLAEQVQAVEQAAIQAALRHTDGNLSAAARLLGIDRNTLKRKRP